MENVNLKQVQENLKVYEFLREVPKEAQKAFNNGRFSGTDINSMWRIKKLTEVFGMCGIGWYYEVTKQWMETNDRTGETKAFTNINLYVKVGNEWSKPIFGTGGNTFVQVTKSGSVTTDDEAYKKSLTDAIGVACKSLGMGADVYWANDRTKYSTPQEVDYVTLINNANSVNDLHNIWNANPHLQANSDFVSKINNRKKSLENG